MGFRYRYSAFFLCFHLILIRYKNMKRIYGYKMEDYWSNIATVDSYYNTNMDFLKPEVRNYFFRETPHIYSKVDDYPPAKYNAGSDVKNSLISSGCIINSKIENSVLFKNVFVGKNCVIRILKTVSWKAVER